MTSHLRNPLTHVWIFLMLITAASWGISHTYDIEYQTETAVTVCVLLIAAVKSFLVICYFMEVRFAAPWLMRCTYGLVGVTFALLLVCYYFRPQMH
jgi:Prokaryotic Cytochrome C oxidase subunit IV